MAMPKRELVCPTCRSRPNKIRLSPSGSQYGCGKCGKWFGPGGGEAREEPATDPPPREAEDERGEPADGTYGLTKVSIALGLKARALPEAVDELVPKALQGTKAFLKSAEIAKALKENMGYGAVEFRRGLAFLHHRVDALSEPRASLGIARDGLDPGIRVQERIFVVALFLKPARDPGFEVPLWARRKLCNENAIYKLRTAENLDAVLQVLTLK